jgi:SAM-dependent methyltransferase
MKEWHKKFFKLWEKIQFQVYTDEQNEAQAKFITKILKLKKGSSVLDVPCGYGRISHILARNGMNVTGIEFNKNLIKYAVKKAGDEGLKINYITGDMRNFTFRKKFDAALCWFGSFGYFSDEDNEKFVKSVYRSLKPGGKFLIDTPTLESIITIFQPVSKNRYGKISNKEERELDLETSRINVKWTIGKQSEHTSIRLYSYKELTDLLARNGFGKFKGTGNYKGDKYKHGSVRLLLQCEKL